MKRLLNKEANKILNNWQVNNMGGNCMVSSKDFQCSDGKYRMVSLDNEMVVIFTATYDEYWNLKEQTEEQELKAVTYDNLNSLKEYLNESQIQDILEEKKKYDEL
jgi:hypothetical protein